MPLPTADRNELLRRYQERARQHATDRGRHTPPSRWRRVGTTLALWPMIPVAVLPVTFLFSVVVAMLMRGVGLGRLGLGVVVAGLGVVAVFAARTLLAQPTPPRATSMWRRWLPSAVAAVFVWIAVAEAATGGRFGDAILWMWLLALVWCWSFVGQDRGHWPMRRSTLWAVGPIAVVVVLALELSFGFFAWRFDAQRDAFTDLARRAAAGEQVRPGTQVGSFEVGVQRRVSGCEASFVLDGWWRDDTRWVAWCPRGKPQRVVVDVRALGGDWYELLDG